MVATPDQIREQYIVAYSKTDGHSGNTGYRIVSYEVALILAGMTPVNKIAVADVATYETTRIQDPRHASIDILKITIKQMRAEALRRAQDSQKAELEVPSAGLKRAISAVLPGSTEYNPFLTRSRRNMDASKSTCTG